MKNREQAVRKNLARTRVVVLIAFATSAVLNVFLLGILVRIGGLELVGQWAFLNTILLTLLLLDFGLTNSLTYHIGRDGFNSVGPRLRSLLFILLIFACLIGVSALLGIYFAGVMIVELSLVALAALAQLASNWMIAIRLGQNEQYWFHVKAILRVVFQVALALLFYSSLPAEPALAFSLALALAGGLELSFVFWITRFDRPWWGPRAPIFQGIALARGFGPLSFVSKGYDPLSRLMIFSMLGPVALASFTIAYRIPAVINQAVSEALRALLPGLTQMRDKDQRQAVVGLLRDAVTGQIVLIGGPTIPLIIHSEMIFRVWLGQSNSDLTLMMQILMGGIFVNTVTVPFFWAAQAFGEVGLLSRTNLIRVTASLALGALAVWQAQGIVAFVCVFALSMVAAGCVALYVAHLRIGIVRPVVEALDLPLLALFLVATLTVNIGTDRLELGAMVGDVWGLIVFITINVTVQGAFALWILKPRKRKP